MNADRERRDQICPQSGCFRPSTTEFFREKLLKMSENENSTLSAVMIVSAIAAIVVMIANDDGGGLAGSVGASPSTWLVSVRLMSFGSPRHSAACLVIVSSAVRLRP